MSDVDKMLKTRNELRDKKNIKEELDQCSLNVDVDMLELLKLRQHSAILIELVSSGYLESETVNSICQSIIYKGTK